MKESRAKLILKYVLPTVLSQCAFFLFTIALSVRELERMRWGQSISTAACYGDRRGIYADHHWRRDHHRHPHGAEGL